MSTGPRARTRMRSRTRRSSRRTDRTSSRESTSCARCARLTRACRAACTCTPAVARSGRSCTPRRRWPSGMDTATETSTEDAQQLVDRVQELQARLEDLGQSVPRDLADELVSAVVQMYGAGLERILAALFEGGPEGERIAGSLADDPLVATLLLIHDLHPVPLEQRVQQALDSVRPYMESHGGNVELLS